MAGKPLLILGMDGLDLAAPGEGAALDALFVRPRDAVSRRDAADPLPNNSVALWNCWMSGADASRHGLPDFVVRAGDPGTMRLIQSSDRLTPPLWERAAAQGARCVVFNVPATYPATPVNGVMVAGSPIAARAGLTCPSPLPPALESRLTSHRSDLEFLGPPARTGSKRRNPCARS
ncbi:MAG: alkaline phosphatase family protein [Deltaproteobacteria bacterium]|nr:alkaline phosphatase family protein [Deltaproteobacteria bacterium]